jgi:hypothetical protein
LIPLRALLNGILHICQVDKFLGDEDKKGLYAWNGFGKVAPAVEG